MNRWVACLMLAAALGAVPAHPAGSWSGEVAAATDYVFRGFSHSDPEPALQAGLRYHRRNGFVAGLWGSTVRFAADQRSTGERRLELHGFAGYSAALSEDWSLSAVLLRYEYPGARADLDTSYSEGEVALLYRDLLQASVAYTPDFLASGFSSLFAELSGRHPLPGLLDLSAGIGRAELAERTDASYTYGHLGVAWLRGRFDLELGYYWTDSQPIPTWGEVADDSWVLSLSTRLPGAP